MKKAIKNPPKEIPWIMGIEGTADGAILVTYSPDGDDQIEDVHTYKFNPGIYSDYLELSELRDMLYEIADSLAPASSRYAKEKIEIRIIHGDKYTCNESNCIICNNQK